MGLLGFEPKSEAPEAPILDQTRRQPLSVWTYTPPFIVYKPLGL